MKQFTLGSFVVFRISGQSPATYNSCILEMKGRLGIIKGYLGTGYKIWICDDEDRERYAEKTGLRGTIAMPKDNIRLATALDCLKQRLRGVPDET